MREVEILLVEDNPGDLELTRSSRRFPRSQAAQSRRHPHRVVTSSHEERDRLESYQLGVNSYVVEPIEFDSFVTRSSDPGLYWTAVNEAAS